MVKRCAARFLWVPSSSIETLRLNSAVSGKRVDFLFIDKGTAGPLAVVEILGPGHYGKTPAKEKEVRHTGEIKRSVCRETGITFIVVDVQEKYGHGWERKVREKTLKVLYT